MSSGTSGHYTKRPLCGRLFPVTTSWAESNCRECIHKPHLVKAIGKSSGFSTCIKGMHVYYWWPWDRSDVPLEVEIALPEDRSCPHKEKEPRTRFQRILQEDDSP
jgi:hypothetical protein